MTRGETLYRKVGGRYWPVGLEFAGFPSDGVWLVEDGRQSLIMKVGELLDPLPYSAMMRGRDRACKALMALWEGRSRVSASDEVEAVLKAVAAEMGAE